VTPRNRVRSVSSKLVEDPWIGISRRYPRSRACFGKVTNITDYGAVSWISRGCNRRPGGTSPRGNWTNKNVHPAKVVSLGDEVEVHVSRIDETAAASARHEACLPNP